MVTRLDELYELTVAIVAKGLDLESDQLDRLLQLREDTIHDLTRRSNISEKDRQLLLEIRQFDITLLAAMETIKAEAETALGRISRSRVQKQVYEQSYAVDSYFIDRKK